MNKINTIGDALSVIDFAGIDPGELWDAPGVDECDSANALLLCAENGYECSAIIAIMRDQLNGGPIANDSPIAWRGGV